MLRYHPRCPYCKKRNTARILYGLPIMDEKLEKNVKKHRIFLGGCVVDARSAKYHCYSCEKDF